MKLFITPLRTLKTINLYKKYLIYTFILNKSNIKINKYELKKYFYKNYLLKVKNINIIRIKKKKKKKKKKFLKKKKKIKKKKKKKKKKIKKKNFLRKK
ncbi:MAG: hypothetical protein NHG05_00140 [Candidatus Shikimatogenerans bostrichidophilus]|nr:MAG: hypothetical protein NHG05_00140 [Candidatus Shikimatogenerans bostrichidophilus]